MDRMLRGMTALQFQEWKAFAQLEPFDEERDDMRFASVVGTLINIDRVNKKQTPIEDLNDIMLRFGDSKKPVLQKTWQQIKSIARMCAISMGWGK